MPYNGDLSNPVMQVRLNLGDTSQDFELLTDAEYQYLLDKYNQNVNRATIDAARSILFKLSSRSRETVYEVGEVYGSDWFKNYRNALIDMLRNPNLTLSVAMPYAGGISKSDMRENDANSDNAVRDIYIGFTEGKKLYDQSNPRDDQNSTIGV